jgi:hypothetical protein
MGAVPSACPDVGRGANGVPDSLDANELSAVRPDPASIIGLVDGTTPPPGPGARLVSRGRQPQTTLLASSAARAPSQSSMKPQAASPVSPIVWCARVCRRGHGRRIEGCPATLTVHIGARIGAMSGAAPPTTSISPGTHRPFQPRWPLWPPATIAFGADGRVVNRGAAWMRRCSARWTPASTRHGPARPGPPTGERCRSLRDDHWTAGTNIGVLPAQAACWKSGVKPPFDAICHIFK